MKYLMGIGLIMLALVLVAACTLTTQEIREQRATLVSSAQEIAADTFGELVDDFIILYLWVRIRKSWQNLSHKKTEGMSQDTGSYPYPMTS